MVPTLHCRDTPWGVPWRAQTLGAVDGLQEKQGVTVACWAEKAGRGTLGVALESSPHLLLPPRKGAGVAGVRRGAIAGS